MKRSLRSATVAFAATVFIALGATAASLLPDQAGQAADMAAGLEVDGLLAIGTFER